MLYCTGTAASSDSLACWFPPRLSDLKGRDKIVEKKIAVHGVLQY
jgi:hypothetical protein